MECSKMNFPKTRKHGRKKPLNTYILTKLNPNNIDYLTRSITSNETEQWGSPNEENPGSN